MKIVEILDAYLEEIIKEKSIKRFKKEFPTKSIETVDLLSHNSTQLYFLQHNAKADYNKIEREETENVISKLVEKIKSIVK